MTEPESYTVDLTHYFGDGWNDFPGGTTQFMIESGWYPGIILVREKPQPPELADDYPCQDYCCD